MLCRLCGGGRRRSRSLRCLVRSALAMFDSFAALDVDRPTPLDCCAASVAPGYCGGGLIRRAMVRRLRSQCGLRHPHNALGVFVWRCPTLFFCSRPLGFQPSGALRQRDHFRPGLQIVQIVCPLLHHLTAFGQVRRAVVRAAVGVLHGMR